MKINCIIIDDEPLSIILIKNHLSSLKQFEIIGEFYNAIDATFFLQNNSVDLIFLDIQMPEVTGIDFLKSLHKTPYTIILSAYKEFAVEGFELDVIDFILKPISFNRLLKSINKFLAVYSQTKNDTLVKKNYLKGNEYLDLFVKDTNKIYRINPHDIYYIEGMREYIKIYAKQDIVITKYSLNRFIEKLPSELFTRIHKSYIINLQMVKAFTTSFVEINNKKIPIGRSYKIRGLDLLNSNSETI